MQLECISISSFKIGKVGNIDFNRPNIYTELVHRWFIYPFQQILVNEKYAYGVSLKWWIIQFSGVVDLDYLKALGGIKRLNVQANTI